MVKIITAITERIKSIAGFCRKKLTTIAIIKPINAAEAKEPALAKSRCEQVPMSAIVRKIPADETNAVAISVPVYAPAINAKVIP